MKWDGTKQARLDGLRAAELAGTLDEAARAELAELIEAVEVEERERLSPAFDRMRAEQAVLRQQVQDVETANEQLVVLAAQQERLLADARQLLGDLQQRHQAVRETYQRITGETLSVGKQSEGNGFKLWRITSKRMPACAHTCMSWNKRSPPCYRSSCDSHRSSWTRVA